MTIRMIVQHELELSAKYVDKRRSAMLPMEAKTELKLAQGRGKTVTKRNTIFSIMAEDNMPYRFVIECSLENRLVDNAFVDDLVVLVKSRLGRYMSPDFNLDELAF